MEPLSPNRCVLEYAKAPTVKVKFSSHGDAVELLARGDRFVQHRSLLVAIRRSAPVACVPQRETSDTRLIRPRISFCQFSHVEAEKRFLLRSHQCFDATENRVRPTKSPSASATRMKVRLAHNALFAGAGTRVIDQHAIQRSICSTWLSCREKTSLAQREVTSPMRVYRILTGGASRAIFLIGVKSQLAEFRG